MLNYTEKDIEKIIKDIFKEKDFSIEAVGNHHLKRHLVYKITMVNGTRMIFKLYYRKRRRSREVAGLKILEGSPVKCPKIINYGNLDNGDEWLIMEFVEGELFNEILYKASEDEILNLFEQMGEELGKIHTFKTFDYLGEWDEEGNCLKGYDSYCSKFISDTEEISEEIINEDLPNKDILLEAIDEIKRNYNLFNIQTESRIRHNDFDGRNILVKKCNDKYYISAVIDFEQSSPGNAETDLVTLYHKYFMDNKQYEKAFFKGYKKYLHIDEKFYDRLKIYLLQHAVGNCSWAYVQAPDYYRENIELIKRVFKL